jgi:hypothetical protein
MGDLMRSLREKPTTAAMSRDSIATQILLLMELWREKFGDTAPSLPRQIYMTSTALRRMEKMNATGQPTDGVRRN